MLEKIHTALWFASRPHFWSHAVALTARKFKADKDGPKHRRAASEWAATRAVTVAEALTKVEVGIPSDGPLAMPPALLEEGEALAKQSTIMMGGPGDLNLLHAIVLLSGATRVIETGVAYGWSSLAILSAMEGRTGARLVSVDMPYPKMGNEAFVGIVVPERFQKPWTLVREPDRNGIKKALAEIGGAIDLCHYDSDKSWWGRAYGFPLLWEALEPGGLFISDDIQDNMAFAEFAERMRVPFAVTQSDEKFVGLMRKP